MKKNIFKSFFLLLLVTLSGAISAIAQTVSLDDARAKALSFMDKASVVNGGKHKVQSAKSLSLAYTSKAGDETYYYVFNNDQSGFIIVGGDEAAQEILGYGEGCPFDYAKIPDNFKWWLSQYNLQIKAAIADVKSGKATVMDATAQRKLAKRKAKATISQLLTTEWDQVAPFNSQIPLYAQGSTGNYALATGCVATAGAQVMKYHNWPDRGIGSKTMSRTVNGVTFSADFANTQYDWANMQDTYSYDTYTGSAADKAVGTLMYHIGVAVDMEYGQLISGGSGASAHTLATRLADTFKYDKGIKYERRSSYADQDWEDMVYAELQAERPVIYGGQSDAPGGGGHAFVCDGYQDGRYHINWGWSGQYNGVFLLTATSTEKALAPNGTGSGGSAASSSYSVDQEIIINIKPDYDGTSQPVKNISAGEYTLPATVVSKGDYTYINGFMYNKGLFSDTFEFAVKLVNTSDPTDIHIAEAIQTMEINPNQGKGYVYYQIPNDVRYGAYYDVYPMFKNDDDEWQLATLPLGFDVPSLQIETPTGLNVEEFAVSNNGYVSEGSFDISLEIKNWGNYSTSAPLILWVFPKAGGSSVDYIDLGTVSLGAKESKHFDLTLNNFVYKNRFEIGKEYYLKAQNRSAGYISSNVYFTFCNDLHIDYTLTPAEWGTLCLPYSAEVPTGLTAYTVTGTDGNLLVKEEVATLEMNKPYLVKGTPGTYSFAGPDTPEKDNLVNGLLVGNTTAAQTYAPQASYVLQSQPSKNGLAFYEVENAGNQQVRQYGAYLKAGSTLTSFFKFADDASGIKEIQNSECRMQDYYYNLNGVRVKSNTRGIVIRNGKLYINK